MMYHGYCHPSFILADIIPIPKESKQIYLIQMNLEA